MRGIASPSMSHTPVKVAAVTLSLDSARARLSLAEGKPREILPN